MLASYLVGIGGSIILATIVSFFWVKNIDYMKKNHPNYKGGDLFGDDENDPDVDYRG